MADPSDITTSKPTPEGFSDKITAAPVAEVDGAPAHQPYVPDDAVMPEFTWPALVTGTLLGLVFAASSLYLVLKVGMTVSASIPVAVLAITLFRAFSRAFGLRQATILENNVVQTAGSAGESIAFGVGVTMPALMLLGFEMSLTRVMVVSILGGLLGILAMIPLRRAFIVKMHGKPGQPGTLLYPEGTACAQVLISGEKGGTTGATVFFGFGVAFVHKFLTEGMSVLVGTARVPVTFINKAAVFAGEMASELLGVGYIIGFRTSAVMMAGAVLGYLVIIPIIYFVGVYAVKAIPPGGKPIGEMSVKDLRDNYLLFIGAGCVASAGIISMCRTLPTIVRSIRGGLATLQGGGGARSVRRTENDMPMSVVLGGSLLLILLLTVFLATEVGVISAVAGAVLVVLFGFLFVTVSSRLTGEIGSSSNPISGMTVATLMLTCLIFLALGWTSSTDRVLALSIAAVVCIASSNGGTTAQSLKTGFLVGGTPKAMQYAILIGALVSALVIGGTLIAFNNAGTVYSTKPENLPEFSLTKEEVARLPESQTHDAKTYKIWYTRNEALTAAGSGYEPRQQVKDFVEENKERCYLVDPETGKLAMRKDNAIMGKLTEDDSGKRVNREFDAPKTQVMGIIINGVLKRDLNWSMVAIGGMLAVMLELCGVSSLAFAVGVYVPIQFSVPIFVGGILRWGIDSWQARRSAASIEAAGDDPEARAMAEVEAIRKSETSPGVLLSSGYIAGGSIAGVLVAFFAFSDTLTKDLARYQYRQVTVGQAGTLEEQSEIVARKELGLGSGSLSPADKERVEKLAKGIAGLNEDEGTLYLWVEVKQGMELINPESKDQAKFTLEEDTRLGPLAAKVLGRDYKAQALFRRNLQDKQAFTVAGISTVGLLGSPLAQNPLFAAAALVPGRTDKLKLPETLPAEAALKVPQALWPALLAFAGLIGIVVLVGTEKMFHPAANGEGNGGGRAV
jgi:putative OPT family oligopeptide transporter